MSNSPIVTTSAGESIAGVIGEAPRRLLLLRHGQTAYNSLRRMQGQLDTDLSDAGFAQAEYVAKYFASAEPQLYRIISSDLRRAADTARTIGRAVDVEVSVDKRLRETDLGVWQGMRYADIDAKWPGMRDAWLHSGDYAPEGGENRRQVAARVHSLVDELFHDPNWPGRTVLLVAHGGTIAAAAATLLGLPDSHFTLFNGMRNTAWAELEARVRPTGELRWYLISSNSQANRMAIARGRADLAGVAGARGGA